MCLPVRLALSAFTRFLGSATVPLRQAKDVSTRRAGWPWGLDCPTFVRHGPDERLPDGLRRI